MKKILFTVLFAVSAAGCAGGFPFGGSDPLERLRADIDAVLADSIFQSTVPSVRVVDPSSGEVLYDRNSHMLIRPASNMKLVTSAAGLHVLGTKYTFKTSIGWDSLGADGTVRGDLYLRGYGNPDLTTNDLDSLARQVARAGIRTVLGNIVVDVSFFDSLQWGTGWMWDDDPAPYQAYVSPLSLNKNCVELLIEPDSVTNSVRVSVIPETRYVHVRSELTIAVDSVQIPMTVTRPATEPPNTLVISGEILRTSRPRREQVTIVWPEIYAGTVFQERLAAAGVNAGGRVVRGRLPGPAAERLWHEWGMDSMVINLNKVSDNLSAEMTLKTIAATAGSPPGSARAGVWTVNRFLSLCGLDTTNHSMVDGSGLSHYNLLRIDLLTNLLVSMYRRDDLFPLYYTSLPIGGVDGTLRGRMRATLAEGNVHAKTGSIAGVSSLSGYVTDRDGRMLVFGMTMQDFVWSSRHYRMAQDRICGILAEFSRRGRMENGK
ncbi:MAG: D-alanyl-D-alanine carboxypeptidase/D-alanyl-D-alanine-endopeptidase [Bacteroidetes bacterium]|jgi:D-alanyl-D-alanine carboxypeptidase/D-alanyl-D-alanine-endopeptidase (penicillin-binding protein 4)|nr:D-alanyl-D-alanine carboxypeptidase/D-alanyl-D-alanine-endopeptidase [Bacteroidota bacterium]